MPRSKYLFDAVDLPQVGRRRWRWLDASCAWWAWNAVCRAALIVRGGSHCLVGVLWLLSRPRLAFSHTSLGSSITGHQPHGGPDAGAQPGPLHQEVRGGALLRLRAAFSLKSWLHCSASWRHACQACPAPLCSSHQAPRPFSPSPPSSPPPGSFFIYRDPESDQWRFFPWDVESGERLRLGFLGDSLFELACCCWAGSCRVLQVHGRLQLSSSCNVLEPHFGCLLLCGKSLEMNQPQLPSPRLPPPRLWL